MMNEIKEIESRIAELEKEVAILKLADITKLDNCVVTLGSMTGDKTAQHANGDFIGVPFSAQPPDAHAGWKAMLRDGKLI